MIVLGDQLVKNLFPGRPAVGSIVLLNGIRFEVVGVLEHIGRGNNTWLNIRSYVPFQVMATYFPIKGENHANSISYINYQPRITDEHLLAEEDVHKIVAHNHGFDWKDQNAFDGWDTIQESKMVGTIFDAMNMFLGTVGHGDARLGRHRRDQHHAGHSERTHPRDRASQGPGRDQAAASCCSSFWRD